MTLTSEQSELLAGTPMTDFFEMSCFGNEQRMWPVLLERLKEFQRPITVWSAACSIGCETWTLAMLCAEAGLTDVKIVACNGNPANTAYAQRGEYIEDFVLHDREMGRITPYLFEKYFVPCDRIGTKGRKLVSIAPSLRSSVEFTHEPAHVPDVIEAADVIMLRTAWVHIEPEERIELVRKLHTALPPDGLVVMRNFFPEEVEMVMAKAGHAAIRHRPSKHIESKLIAESMREAWPI